MSDIKTKIEAETKDLKEASALLLKKVTATLSGDMEAADTHEVGEVFDMINDIAEAKEKCIKGMYYEQLMEAMQESEYGEDYDEDGPLKKGYRGRSATTGRFVHRAYDDRDMDRNNGRMYYAGEYTGTMPAYLHNMTARSYEDDTRSYEEGERRGFERGMNAGMQRGRSYMEAGESRYDRKRRSYKETKDQNPGSTEKEREAKAKALDDYLGTIADDISEMIMDMDQHQKMTLKNRLQELQNKVV